MSNSIGLNNLIKLEKIGEGSFGEVFKAKDEETNEIYAVKIFRTEFNKNSENFLEVLFSEVGLYSKFNHPAILPFKTFSYFGFDDEQRPAIVTKFAQNGSLDQIIQLEKEYPLIPFWNKTKILCNIYGIASAIAYLHAHNIAHLDLKPANILLDEYLFPLVCDFGLAKILDSKEHGYKTSTSTEVRGTVTHIAPEIWKNENYSTACDTYSFSLVVYSIFTNEEPFEKYNQFQFFTKIINDGERPELNSKIPEPFKKLITKCWAEDPQKRPDFNHIVKELAENPEYLIDGVDRDKYHKYVDLINQYQTTFDSNDQINNHEDIMKDYFEKVIIKDEINKEPAIGIAFENLFANKIEELNDHLPLKKQETIKNFIFNEDKKVNFYKVHINSDQVNALYNDGTLNSPYLINILKFFRNISMDIQFPSNNYYSIMTELTTLKTKNIKRIEITGIVSNVNAIGSEFKNNTIINNIIIKPPVATIAAEAFRGCIFLKKITIPSTVTVIENKTFSICEKLEKVTILSNIKKIGDNAFRGDHMLKQISIPSSVEEIGKSCFRGDNTLEKIKLPENLIAINKSAFKGCVLLREIVIPPKVKFIDSGAFEECVKLIKIVIPSSVEVVKDIAFKCCVELRSVAFDPLKTKIEENAFYDCSNLHTLYIRTAEDSFLMDMKPFPNVNEIVIPKNVTSIQNPLPGITITVDPSNIGDRGIVDIPMSRDSIGDLGVDSLMKY